MKKITQTEFISLIKEKQENAINALKFVSQQLTTKEGMFEKALKEEKNKAYIDAYEDLICYLTCVVIVPEEVKKEDLKKFFEKAPITPYIAPKVEQREPAPEHIEEEKELLDSLCNKCGKTKEECPFHRIGSAYEDCSGFIEQKPARNDRFREFKEEDGDITYIDGKAIESIEVDEKDNGYITIKLANSYSFFFHKNEFDYTELVEWWKYWKQN